MTGVLYLLALIAVGWLVAWTIRDPARPTSVWWPFDMQGEEPPPPPSGEGGRFAARSGPRSDISPWRDRQTAASHAAAEPVGRRPSQGRTNSSARRSS